MSNATNLVAPMTKRKSTFWRLLGVGMGVVLLFLLGVVVPLDWVTTLTDVFLYILLAEAWNILGGYTGYINFGMVAFFGIGAYTTGILSSQYGMSPFLAVPLSGVAGVLFGVIAGIPSLRLRGPYFAILTLIIGFVTQALVMNLPVTGGASGIYLQPLPFDSFTTEQVFYYTFLALMLLAVSLVFLIEHSKFGYALVAIREDEDPAEILGVRTTWLKSQALLIGVFIAGIAGGIYALHTLYIEPQGTFSLDISINVVLMTLAGGMGTWQGPLIGVPLMMIIAQVLRTSITQIALFGSNLPPEFDRVIYGLILVIIALFAPYGVMGLFRRVRGRRFTV